MKRRGRKSAAQTPAPLRERIFGSKKNKKGSAKSKTSASSIVFGDTVMESIRSLVKEHNAKFPNKKIHINTAKAVVRRGMGAYSTSHRPRISMGRPNSRVAWGLARLKTFIDKKAGRKVKKAYIQDDDLL